MKSTERHNVSVVSKVYDLFKNTPGCPGLTALLDAGMRAWLSEHGVTPPPPLPPTVTAKATAARWRPKAQKAKSKK